jgi:hypothetical protein
MTTYAHPEERMLFDARRDANPFFHIFEGIWMLAGRDDAKWISQFSSNISQFAEASGYFHGAYGNRWRNHFNDDQIVWVIEHLRKKPESRRAVLQMYDPDIDQETDEDVPKDIPCNTAIYFAIVNGKLNMTVTNRSNDMIWGAYGANAVHMSMLQEFVACALGRKVGYYFQFSNDFHIYERHFPLMESPADPIEYLKEWKHVPITEKAYWSGDLIQFEQWIERPEGRYDAVYINQVLNPMLYAWLQYKLGDRDRSMAFARLIEDGAVRFACEEWLGRRKW